jgi:hypothetical protein
MDYTDNSLNKLRDSTIKQLTDRFELVDCFDFFLHDNNPNEFYAWAEKWKDYTFLPNQRILILNIDTDYYVENQQVPMGNNNYNFFRCCQYFGLPTEFLIYFSATYGMHTEIFNICKLFNVSPPTVIESIFIPLLAPQLVNPINYSTNKLSRLFICLNGEQRSHRILFLSHLANSNLVDQGYISHMFRSSPNSTGPLIDTCGITNTAVALRSTIPFIRINDLLLLTNNDHALLTQYSKKFINQYQDLSSYPDLHDNRISDFQPSFLQHALIYVITETVYDYPYSWISEKTIKGILSKRPFILVGSKGTLAQLKLLGFKTFESIWDESYDTIDNSSIRMTTIISLLTNLSNRPINELANQVQEIVEYNYNHYCSNFINDDKLKWYYE